MSSDTHDDRRTSEQDELERLRDYHARHEACRRDLSLWLLEMENKHHAQGLMLERLRNALVPG